MKRIADLIIDGGPGGEPDRLLYRPDPEKKKTANILALGDVGRAVLLGLILTGGDQIREIGILDLDEKNLERLEMECGQIFQSAAGPGVFPRVRIIKEEELFDCDVFLFAASRGVPPIGASGDVRMAQLQANRELVSRYGKLAKEAAFRGFAAIISDPVDPLAKAFLLSSGLAPGQVQGFGLGVMYARARYYAERDPRFSRFPEEGRAFGPHGQDLVIADSMKAYDDGLSKELTKLAVEANLRVRELGFKPYIAPALSSAALSILAALRGDWHESSVWIGRGGEGAFLGIRNRFTENGAEYEDLPLEEALYERILGAYKSLADL